MRIIEPSTAAEKAASRRRRRWERRHTYQRVVDRLAAASGGYEGVPGRRTAGCGRWTHGEAEGVEVRAQHGDDGPYTYVAGVQTCGSVWSCPVCSAKIRARRSIEVEAAAAAHEAAGGGLVMLTLTVRHERRHELDQLVEGLRLSWRAIQTRKWWKGGKHGGGLRSALTGTVTALEVTQGPNGWHPHLHLLVMVKPGADTEAVAGQLGQHLPAVWRGEVGRRLGVSPSLAHGVHVLVLDAGAATYVAKIADEVTRSDLKGDGTSPWVLLDKAAKLVDDGDVAGAEPLARWCEFATVMKGKRAIVWSRGLRDHFGLGVEKSDEEAAAEDEDGELLEVLDVRVWAKLCRTRNEQGTLESVALLERWEDRLRAGPVSTALVGQLGLSP